MSPPTYLVARSISQLAELKASDWKQHPRLLSFVLFIFFLSNPFSPPPLPPSEYEWWMAELPISATLAQHNRGVDTQRKEKIKSSSMVIESGGEKELGWDPPGHESSLDPFSLSLSLFPTHSFFSSLRGYQLTILRLNRDNNKKKRDFSFCRRSTSWHQCFKKCLVTCPRLEEGETLSWKPTSTLIPSSSCMLREKQERKRRGGGGRSTLFFFSPLLPSILIQLGNFSSHHTLKWRRRRGGERGIKSDSFPLH